VPGNEGVRRSSIRGQDFINYSCSQKVLIPESSNGESGGTGSTADGVAPGEENRCQFRNGKGR